LNVLFEDMNKKVIDHISYWQNPSLTHIGPGKVY